MRDRGTGGFSGDGCIIGENLLSMVGCFSTGWIAGESVFAKRGENIARPEICG